MKEPFFKKHALWYLLVFWLTGVVWGIGLTTFVQHLFLK